MSALKVRLKRPVVLEAMQWQDTDEQREAFAAWFAEIGAELSTSGRVVDLDNGFAAPGDWVVLHADGEFYVYDSARFKATFVHSTAGAPVIRHAEHELRLAGLFDQNNNESIAEPVMELVRVLARQDESVDRATTVEAFARVANYKALTPLTDHPEEWTEITPDMRPYGKKVSIWRSMRQPTCFSNDGGKTYYDIHEPEVKGYPKSSEHRPLHGSQPAGAK